MKTAEFARCESTETADAADAADAADVAAMGAAGAVCQIISAWAKASRNSLLQVTGMSLLTAAAVATAASAFESI